MSKNLRFVLLAFFLISCTSKQKGSDSSYKGLGQESVSSEEIKKYQAPPLDSKFAKKIESYLNIRPPAGAQVTLDGKTLFYNWNKSGINQVWKQSSPSGKAKQLTTGNERTVLQSIAPNQEFIVVSLDKNGEENPGLYWQSTKGGEVNKIFHQKKVQAHFGFIPDDSASLFYFANDIKEDSYALYQYNFKTGERSLIFDDPGVWDVADFIDDKVLLAKYITNTATEYWELDLKTKKSKPIVGQGEKESFDVKYLNNSGGFLISTNKFSDFYRLYKFENKKFTPITGEVNKELAGFSIDHQRKRIYLLWQEQGYIQPEVLDAIAYKPIPFLPSLYKKDHIRISQITRDGRYVVLNAETATSPSEQFVWDWQPSNKNAQVKKWTMPKNSRVNTSKFVGAKLEYAVSRDNVKIPMFVYRSKKCEKVLCPVIVHFHGGPESQSRPGFKIFAQLVLDAGFTFVEPNVRGSDGFGKKWLDSDNGPKRLNVITDIQDVARYIKTHWQINGKSPEIGVMGGSYGGYSTLYAMTKFAGTYSVGVASVGMSNLVTFLENTAPYRRSLRTPEYGDPEKDRKALIELSPMTYINELQAPLLITQGVNDPRVPVGEALQFKKELDKKNIAAGLILFADEGHGSAKTSNQILELGHTLKFFKEHLK